MTTVTGNSRQALIIDDDESFRSVLTAMLEKLNFNVMVAVSGDEGLHKADGADALDLVVLDLFLPDVRGDKVCPALKKKHPDVNIFVMSGYAMEDAEKFLDDPIQVFLQKPCSFSDFSAAVKNAFG